MDRSPRHSTMLKTIAAACVLGLLGMSTWAILDLLSHPLIGLCP